MGLIKTLEEIEIMRQGGALLSVAMQKMVDAVKSGITMSELDQIAEQTLIELGAKPSFKGYKSGDGIEFPSTVCISRNEEVVHGLGNRDIELEDGDIVGLDVGCWYKDLCTDMAVTVPVGNISKQRLDLLRKTREVLDVAVQAAQPGNMISDIGKAIEEHLKGTSYGIVRALTGHGVGHAVHEKPSIPNFYSNKIPDVKIKPGMCLALEPMITTGDHHVETADDGWSVVTKDGSDAAHFEVTIAILENGPEILTKQPNLNFN